MLALPFTGFDALVVIDLFCLSILAFFEGFLCGYS